jgi:hypothetical protein
VNDASLYCRQISPAPAGMRKAATEIWFAGMAAAAWSVLDHDELPDRCDQLSCGYD